jgi:hypothetical protein
MMEYIEQLPFIIVTDLKISETFSLFSLFIAISLVAERLKP